MKNLIFALLTVAVLMLHISDGIKDREIDVLTFQVELLTKSNERLMINKAMMLNYDIRLSQRIKTTNATIKALHSDEYKTWEDVAN